MPTALSTINVAKEQAATYQPLLLAEFTFADGAVLRLSSHPLNTSEGGVQYGGNDYMGRISDQTIQQVQALSETGVDLVPSVSLTIADPAGYIYSNWETAVGRGFKGATLTLRFVFYDIASGTFSSDSRTPFVGVCEKPSSDAARLTVNAVAKTSLMRALLPIVPIQQRCPWINPTTTAQRAEASDEDSCFYECGETRDTTTAPPCSYTKATCTQPNRFGGITYSAPAGMRVREYVSGNWLDVRGITNDAAYGDRIPMLYGKAWVEPPVLTAIPDGNYLRGECIVSLGPVDIYKVLVNGVELSAANEPDGTPLVGANPDFRYNWINDGTRDGSPNLDTPWSGNGDPYGSMSAIMFCLPRSQGGGDGVPRVRVLAKRKNLRKYQALTSITVTSNVAVATLVGANTDIASNDPSWAFEIIGTSGAALNAEWTGLSNWTAGPPGTFTFATSGVADGTYAGGFIQYKAATENAAWIIADLLTWTNYRYEDLDLASFCAAAQTLESRPSAIVLRQRRSAAEIIRSLRQAHGLLLIPEHSTGKLHLYVKQTLADQQPATISGSNYDTAVSSKTAAGITANGYAAYRFDAASILRSDLPISLKELPRSAADSPNRISLSFQDPDSDYAVSTLSVVDSDDAGRLDGQEIAGSLAVTAEGLTSYADAMRSARVGLAEIHRGNSAGDTRGTRVFEWDTTFRALHLRVGHIVLLNDTLKGLTNQPVRITKIQPGANYETVRITAHWHDDNWYTDAFAATGELDPTQYTPNPVSDASPLDIGGTVGSNLIRNAGFEVGKAQWHGDIDNANITVVTDEYDSGLQSLKIAATGATEIHQPYWFEDGKYDVMPCTEGESFIFTGRYKFDSASAASSAQARIAFYDSTGGYIDAGTVDLDPADTDWTDFAITATAPATAKYMGIFPWFGQLTAGAVYLDTLNAARATEPEAPGHVTDLAITIEGTVRLRGRLMNIYQLTGVAPVAAEHRGFSAVHVYAALGEGEYLDLGRHAVTATPEQAWAVTFRHDAPDAALLGQTFVAVACNPFAEADFATAPTINIEATGEATLASAPSNVLQTIVGNAQNEYSIKLDWAKPVPQDGVQGYHWRSVIYSDELGETEVETIDHPGIPGYDVQAAWSQYRTLPTEDRWIKTGIRSYNAYGQTSVWVWSDLAPLVVDPATIVPQPGIDDWAIIDPTEANGGYGANAKVQKARLRINLIAIPAGCDYVTAWVYIDGQYRDMMNTATLGYNDIWIDQPTVQTTYDCKLVGNRYSAIRMWGSDNDVKTFTVAAWQLPAALSTFTVTAEADDGGTGKTLYRLKYVVTASTDINRMGVAIFARWTDASWAPVAGTDGDWKEVSWIKSTENSLTWYSSNDYQFAAPGPGVTEYRQFAAIAKNYADDYDFDDAIVVNSTRTSDGGFDAGTIDPTTVGPGLTVDGDGLASLSRGLMNGDFEAQLDGWVVDAGWTASATDQYSGSYCAKGAAQSAYSALKQLVPVAPGQLYRFQCYAKSTQNVNPIVVLAFRDSTQANYLTPVEADGWAKVISSSSYALYEVYAKAPATAAYAQPYVLMYDTATSGNVFVDQCQLFAVEATGAGLTRTDSGVANTERGLKNSDFEFGLTDWNYSAQWTADTAEAYKGTAAKCTCNGVDQYLCQDLPVAPGQVVRFEAWAKESGNSTSSIQIIWYTAAGSVISTLSTTITGDTYALYAVVGTAPATAATARVNIAVPAANTSGRVMVDQAAVKYLEPVTGAVTRDANGVNLSLDSDALIVDGGEITTVASGILAKLGISDQFKKEDGVLKVNAIAVNYLAAGTAVFTGTARFQSGASGGYVEITGDGVDIAKSSGAVLRLTGSSIVLDFALADVTLTQDGISCWNGAFSGEVAAESFKCDGVTVVSRYSPSGILVSAYRVTCTDTFTHSGSGVSLSSQSNWRTALGLGDSATKNVGTGSGDVAAGNHNHTGVYAAASHSHSYDDISCSGKFKSPGYQTEAIALSGITTIGWVPAYDCSGNYIGKIPVFT